MSSFEENMKAASLLLIVLLVTKYSNAGLQPQFLNGAYRDLIVSVSPDVPAAHKDGIIQGIKVRNLKILKIKYAKFLALRTSLEREASSCTEQPENLPTLPT